MTEKFRSFVEYSFVSTADGELIEYERERFFIDDEEVAREQYSTAISDWAGAEAIKEMPSSAGRALKELTQAE